MSAGTDDQILRESAGIGALSPRLQLAVAGKDRASYLQGLLTNDIQALPPGSGCYAAWLSPQGRMLTDLHVLESGGMILLDVPAELAGATLARLEQFLFTEEVKLGSMAESLTGVWLHGPQAADVLERSLEGAQGLSLWRDYQHTQLEFVGEPVVVARINQLLVPGYCVYLDRSREAAFRSALQSSGATSVGEAAVTAARIEAGYPVFGIDMTEDTIPLEAGIEARAISLDKGCYVGQEVIIRVLHRGHGRVARRLVGLRVEGPGPAAGARLLAADRDVGFVTSSAVSSRLGTIALGYAHRDFVAEGTRLETPAEAGRTPVVVSALPMR